MHLPSALSIPALWNIIVVSGVVMMFTPAIRLVILEKFLCEFATCAVTSDDEHAVSILMAGPRKSNMKDNLPEATLKAPPVAL